MEELRSTRHWGKKSHGSAVFEGSNYGNFFRGPPRNTTSLPSRFEDYSEIFGSAASAFSIPVLDLPPADDDFAAAGDGDRRVGVDYSEIFAGGGFSGGGFMVSYEELFGCSRGSEVSSLEQRARCGVLSEQQANEASEHLLEGYSEDHSANLEMDEVSLVPNHSDDVNSKKFSASHHKTSCRVIDDLISQKTNTAELDVMVDASDLVLEMKNQQVNEGITDNTGTKRYMHDGGQQNEAPSNSSSNAASSENLKIYQAPSKSNCDSPIDAHKNDKHHSRSSSYHSASSGDISLSDVEYLNISEISLQTKPLQGPPPSRLPPQLIKETEHPKMVHIDSSSDLEDGSLLKLKLKYHMHSSSGAPKIHALDEYMEGNSCCYDNEMDPTLAAAASVAAVKAAMEQAQVQLKIAKELMDRKRDKYKRKIDQPKAMTSEEDGADYDVALKSCRKAIAANSLLNNSINEYAFLEREEIRNAGITTLNLEKKGRFPSYGANQQQVTSDNGFKSTEAACEFDELSGEWRKNELIRNGSLLNKVRDNNMHENEMKAKATVNGCQDTYNDDKKGEQVFEVLGNQKSSEASGIVEKLEIDHNLSGASMAYMKDSNKNVVSAIMEDFLHTESASKLNGVYVCHVLDDTRKEGGVHKENTSEDGDNSPNFTVGSCLSKDGEMLQASNSILAPGVDNDINEETEFRAVEFLRNVENKREFHVCNVDFEINESHKVFKVANEVIFQGSFDEKIREDEADGLLSNEEAFILTENEPEQGAIRDANGLENGKERRDSPVELQEDESMGPARIQELHNFEFFAAAERDCAEEGIENASEICMVCNLEKNLIISSSLKVVCQQCEESDAPEIILSRKEDKSPAKVPDKTEVSHDEVAEKHKNSIHTEEEENKKADREKERDKERAIRLEEKEREREREKDRIAVERANHDGGQRALAEARERAERFAVERVTAEARERALAEAREKTEKTAEAEKASRGARLRAERAAVERATEEARQRAIEKALAEKAAIEARSRIRKGNATAYFKAAHAKEDSETRIKFSSEILQHTQSQSAACSIDSQRSSDACDNGGNESKLRCKARQERQQRTAERAAKALAEKNLRDILAQREQAERDRLAESLDAEVRRWSTGKEGNLRALLSTLQYILGSDSGWQPIPLTDVLTAAAVKKAYRKATLCVHPDKLQQRGATIQQKYICEKVFDLLKEAWNKSNSEER